MSKLTHEELVKKVRDIIYRIGLTTFVKRKSFPSSFVPDIETNVGGMRKDKIIIDVLTTRGSYHRVLGGLYSLRSLNLKNRVEDRVRHFVMVVDDYLFSSEKSIQLLASSQTDIAVLPFSKFEEWLKTEIAESAKEKVIESFKR